MSKITDYIEIAKSSLAATKTVVNEIVNMGKEVGGMVGQVRQLFPKRKPKKPEVEPENDELEQKDET
jgi:phosphate uptake regulator